LKENLFSSLCFSLVSSSLVCVDVPVDAFLSHGCDASSVPLTQFVGVVTEPLPELVVKLALRLETSLGIDSLFVGTCTLAVQLGAGTLTTSVHRRQLRLFHVGRATLPADLT